MDTESATQELNNDQKPPTFLTNSELMARSTISILERLKVLRVSHPEIFEGLAWIEDKETERGEESPN